MYYNNRHIRVLKDGVVVHVGHDSHHCFAQVAEKLELHPTAWNAVPVYGKFSLEDIHPSLAERNRYSVVLCGADVEMTAEATVTQAHHIHVDEVFVDEDVNAMLLFMDLVVAIKNIPTVEWNALAYGPAQEALRLFVKARNERQGYDHYTIAMEISHRLHEDEELVAGVRFDHHGELTLAPASECGLFQAEPHVSSLTRGFLATVRSAFSDINGVYRGLPGLLQTLNESLIEDGVNPRRRMAILAYAVSTGPFGVSLINDVAVSWQRGDLSTFKLYTERNMKFRERYQ